MTEPTTIFESTTRFGAEPVEMSIRPLHPDDAAQLHAMRSCPGVMRQNPMRPYPTLQQAQGWLAKLAAPSMAIAALVGDTLVGAADLHPGALRRAHSGWLGISVHDDWQGKGVGTRLMAELIDAADNWYGLRRLELNVFADNHRAIALYRKFGFSHEATFRGAVLRDGMLIDSVFMGRLRAPMGHLQAEIEAAV